MVRMRVKCEVCDKGVLERIDDAEVEGYLCEFFGKYEEGEKCNQLVDVEDVKERWEEEEREREVERVAAAKEEAGGEDASDDDDEEDEEEDEPVPMSMSAIREANIKALVDGSVTVERAPLIPKLLTVEQTLRRPFKSPHPNAPDRSDALRRKLAARKIFVPWGGKGGFKLPSLSSSSSEDKGGEEEVVSLPPEVPPCVVWEPGEGAEPGAKPITVDPMLTKWLREHQREGVKFMFECVTGLRTFGDMEGNGCILADDMGLGKTLQGIALAWTLLKQGFDGKTPIAKRVVVVCPTSLVANWDSEFVKFLQGRCKTLPIAEASKAEVERSMRDFLNPRGIYQIMMVSYETFRIYAHMFTKEGTCDLLICDEAHRLKNDATLTNQALGSMACRRRVLLTGTPMQNHLDEYFAMVNFTNPGVFGTNSSFRKVFERPILRGREPDASDADRDKGLEASGRMSEITNGFVLRRTNKLLSKFLPPKVVQVVCCKMTEMQVGVYNHFLHSKTAAKLLREGVARDGEGAKVLSAITALKKLSNHPKLIYDCIHGSDKKQADGFEDCAQFFPPGVFDDGRPGRSGRSGGCAPGWELHSGKFAVLSRLLHTLRTETTDRIVIVSNYTQTLELLRLLCTERGYPFVMIDGQCSQKKRKKMCLEFNDMNVDQFVFLLSSKAGGCGLNLVGGNRLVLFDPDWNPATDKQAMARVWRDGQKKRVFLYRFVSTGTIEEKVFQRQLSKEGLQSVVDGAESGGGKGAAGSNLFGAEDLRDIFSYKGDVTSSDTHDSLNCTRCTEEAEAQGEAHRAAGGCGGEGQEDAERALAPEPWERQVQEEGEPVKEEDLSVWAHHHSTANLPDPVMRRIAGDDVSFIFSCQVDGMPVEYSTYSRTGHQAAPRPQGLSGWIKKPAARGAPPTGAAGRAAGAAGAGGAVGAGGAAGRQAPLNLPRPPLPGGMRRAFKPLHNMVRPGAAGGAAGGGAAGDLPPKAKKLAPAPAPPAAKPAAAAAAAGTKRKAGSDDDSDFE